MMASILSLAFAIALNLVLAVVSGQFGISILIAIWAGLVLAWSVRRDLEHEELMQFLERWHD